MEKQKAKYTYGILERQFRNLFDKANSSKGVTGEVLLQLCETRLDNIVYRLGITKTRNSARQLVSHRHITINGNVNNIPSTHVKVGDVVGVREKSKSLLLIDDSLSISNNESEWLSWDIGNALRRVMLSSLEGFAITSVRIDKVDHEFSTLVGVVEDVTELILNFKQIRFKQQIDSIENETVNVAVTNQKVLTAGDLQKFISGFQILNPEFVICNLDEKVQLNFEFTIEKGRGYVPAEENKKSSAPLGTIAIDSIFTPIKNVKYSIENFRVEQKTDFEKLIFEIVTDGSINPKDALTEAAKTLIHHFMLFSDEKITLEADDISESETYDEESLHMRQLLKTRLTDMDLSVRALNCLKAAEVDTLGDLVSFNKSDWKKIFNRVRRTSCYKRA